MIYTLLLNPTIDEIVEVSGFEIGGTFLAHKVHVYPVGKAISVALTLKELGELVHNFSFIGENDITLYEEFLFMKGISFNFILVHGKTRSNKTILDRVRNTITHIRLPGFEVSTEEVGEMTRILKERLRKDDILCFSGSLPKGLSVDFLVSLSTLCKDMGVKFVIDSSGEPLKQIDRIDPWFIKGNIEEMAEIYPEIRQTSLFVEKHMEKAFSHDELDSIFKDLNEIIGDRLHVITMGKNGSIVIKREKMIYAEYKTDALYTVGCGDAYLGGLLYGLAHRFELEECIRIATACGVSNTELIGAGVLKRETVDKYKELVRIKVVTG